jgi:hypothetical protein
MKIMVLILSFFFATTIVNGNVLLPGKIDMKRMPGELSAGCNSIYDIIEHGGGIWLATEGGVMVTYDNGDSWECFDQFGVFTDKLISAIYSDGHNIWAAVNSIVDEIVESRGLVLTEDGGQSWQAIDDSVLTANTVGQNNIVYDLTGEDSILFAASFAGGLVGSFNGGNNWRSIYFSAADSIGSIGGNPPLSNRYFSAVCDHHHGDSLILWAGSADGLRRFVYSGKIPDFDTVVSFEYPLLTGNFVTALGVQPPGVAEGRIWASTQPVLSGEYRGVSTGTLQGSDWYRIADLEAWNFDFCSDSVFAAASSGLLFSQDTGHSWDTVKLDSVSDTTWITAVRVVGNYLWVGTLGEGLVIIDLSDFSQQRYILLYSAPVGIVESAPAVPFTFGLYQNHPNPFNPATIIEFSLARRVPIRLEIYNLLGQRVRTLIDGMRPAGSYRVNWDGTDESSTKVSSGIYFFRLEAGDFSDTRKMVLLR